MNDYERLAEQRRETHPYEYAAPYEPVSKAAFENVPGNFVWIPFEKEGYALFLFDDAADRDAFAEQFEEVEAAA